MTQERPVDAMARHGVGSPVAGHADNALIAGSIPARPLERVTKTGLSLTDRGFVSSNRACR